MAEVGPVYADTKTITTAGTPEALTTRSIACTSVFIRGLATNTGVAKIVDSATDAKTTDIPAGGLSLPVSNPALIEIDVAVNGEGVEWVAI